MILPMIKNISFHNFLPHFTALIVFLIITTIFFYPILFKGKVMSLFDARQGGYSGTEVSEFRKKTGEEALWTDAMFGGMPAYLISVRWSGDIIHYIHRILTFKLAHPARYIFLAMLCFYILLLALKVNPYLSIAGAVVYGINSFMLLSLESGHIWKIYAIAYMPLVLAGIQLVINKKTLLGIALTAMAISLQIRTQHYQITYYLFFIILVFVIVYLIHSIKTKSFTPFFKSIVFIGLGLILGLSTGFGKLWSSMEYSTVTIRGKSELTSNTKNTSGGLDRDYAFSWSQGVFESLTFVVPYLYGGGSSENVDTNSTLAKELEKAGVSKSNIRSIVKRSPTYWGDQPFTAGPVYIGIICVFLFVLATQSIKNPLRNWLIIASSLGFMLAFGKNASWFNYIMFDYFPFYNKFRSVSMALIIPILCMPVLAFVGLDAFLKKPDKKIIYRSVTITGGLIVLIWISSWFMNFDALTDASIKQDFFVNALKKQRASMLRSSAFISLFFTIAVASLLYYFSLKKINKTILISLVTFLVFLDLYIVGKQYINKEKFSRRKNVITLKEDDADKRINTDNSHYRVANLTANIFNDAATSRYHLSVGGYHAAKLRRYQDAIDFYIKNELGHVSSQINAKQYNISGIPILNMLNTKYFKLGSSAYAVLTNQNALGNAWFVEKVKPVKNPDEAIQSIGIEDLSKIAIIEHTDLSMENLSVGAITLTDYRPNHLTYQSENDEDGFAVFSEIYYKKGWKAFVDEQKQEIYHTNYLLRGLQIPTGNHKIEFKFEPKSYIIGNSVMRYSNYVIYSLIFIALASIVIKKRKELMNEKNE